MPKRLSAGVELRRDLCPLPLVGYTEADDDAAGVAAGVATGVGEGVVLGGECSEGQEGSRVQEFRILRSVPVRVSRLHDGSMGT